MGWHDGRDDGRMGMAPQANKLLPAADSPALSRKIVYDAQIDLITENVDPIAKKMTALVQEARGYIAEENTTGSPGSRRLDALEDPRARRPVRILRRQGRRARGARAEQPDVAGRDRAVLRHRGPHQEQEGRGEDHHQDPRGAHRQARGGAQGRGRAQPGPRRDRAARGQDPRPREPLRALATLTVNVREREKFQPPPPVAADFPTQIARTWSASVQALVDRLKAIVLWAVDWAIWLPLLLVSAIVAWVLGRWLLRLFFRHLPRMIALARTPITPAPRAIRRSMSDPQRRRSDHSREPDAINPRRRGGRRARAPSRPPPTSSWRTRRDRPGR